MALSRADVLVRDPGGTEVSSHDGMSVSVRDGMARMKQAGGQLLVEMQAAGLSGRGRNWLITGADGTTWNVTKKCNCGSR